MADEVPEAEGLDREGHPADSARRWYGAEARHQERDIYTDILGLSADEGARAGVHRFRHRELARRGAAAHRHELSQSKPDQEGRQPGHHRALRRSGR